MFRPKTFKAKIHGAITVSEGQIVAGEIITFNKQRILLTDNQIQRLFLNPVAIPNDPINHKESYKFDKLLNRDDEKMYSIILTERITDIDKSIYHLDISFWNKIRANIIHNRYWLDREKEWFAKTLISTLIGFLFGLMGVYVGYRIGLQSGTLPKIKTQQEQNPPKRQ